ncbi:MAG: hypothetical protein H6677_09070 [Candidatus Obscuribacterales bacterium]|nr:hypothetical protein [Cyanobacteria bacterium HKST-UBA01]MCB9468419.1 hypothetical protein [Candidatus Obscuribacterales bacterium]
MMTSVREEKSESVKNDFGLVSKLAILVALIPIANMFWIVSTVGCDVVSNDYLTYAHLIDRILSGQYDLSHLVSDTFYRGHATTLAFLTHLASAKFFCGSVMPELYLAFVLSVFRLVLIYDAIRTGIQAERTWWLLPILAFFIFSNSQVALYTYPGAALPIGISLFGQALAIWALARFKTSWTAVLVATAGGLISSYSWGIGPITWLTILAYYLYFRQFDFRRFLALLSGAGLSAIPYVMSFFASAGSTGATDAQKTIISFFNLKTIVNLLGWPLAKDIATATDNLPEARFAGSIGLVIAAGFLILLAVNRNRIDLKKAAVPLVLIISSLLAVWEISMVRSLLAPWYTPLPITFWVGLLGLAALLLSELNPKTVADFDLRSRISTKWSMLTVVVIIACFARSNQTYSDKTYMLNARAPASYSALYNAERAPTYADQYIFLWTPGSPSLLQKLAEVMKRHNISAFAPVRKIWLQGDYMMNSVSTDTVSGAEAPYFTDNLTTLARCDWADYKKLDLVLPPGSSLSWKVTLPENLQEARLSSKLQIQGTAAKASGIYLITEDSKERKYIAARDNTNLNIELNSYAGKKLQISFANRTRQKDSPTLIYRMPRLVLILKGDPAVSQQAAMDWRPDNTEYGNDIEKMKPNQSSIDLSDALKWKAIGGVVESLPDQKLIFKAAANETTFEYQKDLNIEAGSVDYMVLHVAAPDSMKLKVLKFSLATDDKERPFASLFLPLLGGENAHYYKYPVRLLNLSSKTKIEKLSFKTVDPEARVEIDSLGFRKD